MGQSSKYGPEKSYEETNHHLMQVVFTRRMREQQIFMDELKERRKRRERSVMKVIRAKVGPAWYQALSVPQRQALDTLESGIYKDLLEGRPIRTAGIMKALGLYPRPNLLDLMSCIYIGRSDPKEMLAHLFLMNYGHTIDGKQTYYCLNARLILSGILYLGLDSLIHLLQERLKAKPEKKRSLRKPKAKEEPPLASPYLQKLVAVLYEKPKRKVFQPDPLPDLTELNEPYEEEPVLTKPPPTPPPPPPPKKKLPRVYCDKLAGIMRVEPHSSIQALKIKTLIRNTSNRRIRGSKLCLTDRVKKTYGMSSMISKPASRRKKPKPPTTGFWNSQYTISGVYTLRGKTVYVLGNVSILPVDGELIHGGFTNLGGENVNIHCGIRAHKTFSKQVPCDCLSNWNDAVVQYVKDTKCYCGHYYDFGIEGTFPQDELPFFEKSTREAHHKFNYNTIYDIDPKSMHIGKEFKKLWDTESLLQVNKESPLVIKDAKKKKKKSSTTCLGQNPRPEDYLKCALRLMRRINVAARLPDIYLVPELKEWMRRRLYGPYSRADKASMLRKSNTYWETLHVRALKGFGHVYPKFDPLYSGKTDWSQKQVLNDKFRHYVQNYRKEVYRSHANITNYFWTPMFQAEFPDKKFREIFFSYLFGKIEDVTMLHPYSSREALERKLLMAKKRYSCSVGSVYND